VIGPGAAGRWAQTSSSCIPRPRLPSTTPNRIAGRGCLGALLWQLISPLGHVRRAVLAERRDLIGPRMASVSSGRPRGGSLPQPWRPWRSRLLSTPDRRALGRGCPGQATPAHHLNALPAAPRRSARRSVSPGRHRPRARRSGPHHQTSAGHARPRPAPDRWSPWPDPGPRPPDRLLIASPVPSIDHRARCAPGVWPPAHAGRRRGDVPQAHAPSLAQRVAGLVSPAQAWPPPSHPLGIGCPV
jgi:hypothetical protein